MKKYKSVFKEGSKIRRRATAILPIGIVNFATGKNKFLDDVYEHGDTIIIVEQKGDKKFIKGIIGSGSPNNYKEKIGDFMLLMHDQTHAPLGQWDVIGKFDLTKENANKIIKTAGKKSFGSAVFK